MKISQTVASACLLSAALVTVPLSTPVYATASPSVSLTSGQQSPLIGEQVQLSVAFDNTGSGASDTGYGPYVDLLLDRSGADGNDGWNGVGSGADAGQRGRSRGRCESEDGKSA